MAAQVQLLFRLVSVRYYFKFRLQTWLIYPVVLDLVVLTSIVLPKSFCIQARFCMSSFRNCPTISVSTNMAFFCRWRHCIHKIFKTDHCFCWFDRLAVKFEISVDLLQNSREVTVFSLDLFKWKLASLKCTMGVQTNISCKIFSGFFKDAPLYKEASVRVLGRGGRQCWSQV